MAAIFGVIIGVPALRLRGDYLAIITLGFGEIIRVLVLAVDFTGGAAGLTGIPYIEGKYTLIIYTFFIAFLTVVAILAFIRSRHGRAVIAIREDEIAAEPPASTPPIINFLPLWWRRFSRALRAAFMRIISACSTPANSILTIPSKS